jgi:glycosyltransferase involved in cell wall biosynthesis
MLRDALSESTIGAVPIFGIGNHWMSLPTKMFEYMAAGLPVLVTDLPLVREIVESARCGVVVEPRSAAALAGGIRELLADRVELRKTAAFARQAALEQFNWARSEGQLLIAYRQLLGMES